MPASPQNFHKLLVSLTGIMKDFANYLIDNDRKPRSVKRHINNFDRILKYAPNFTQEEIDAYFIKLKEEGRKNTYINSMVNTVRVYARFKGLSDDLLKYRYRKKEVFAKATMSDEEIEGFLNLPYPGPTKAYYDRRTHEKHEPLLYKRWGTWTIFFSIMAFSGMRPGEVANLKVEDIDFGRQIFVIKDSKTNQPGVAPIAPNISASLKSYVAQLENDYLFPSVLGGNKDGVTPVFDNVDWHYHFHKRLKLLGIKRPNLTPYSFRHSYATRLLESDVSLFHVKKLLRHSDLRSTLVYEHLTTKDLIDAVQKLPLVRRGTDPKVILQALVEVIKKFKLEDDDRIEYKLEETDHSIKFEAVIKDLERRRLQNQNDKDSMS